MKSKTGQNYEMRIIICKRLLQNYLYVLLELNSWRDPGL